MRKGVSVVGVKGASCVVLAAEKKSVAQLQDPRTVRKVAMLDKHIALAFAGLAADARVLTDRARVQCQSHRLNIEDPITVERITKHIAGIQQRYTHQGGVRPFGISTLIVGHDPHDPKPHLFLTEPSGIYSSWRANAIGRSSKTIREMLEKIYVENMDTHQTIKLAIKSLLQVVSGNKIELMVMESYGKARMLDEAELKEFVTELDQEKEAEAERKRTRLAAASQSQAQVLGR